MEVMFPLARLFGEVLDPVFPLFFPLTLSFHYLILISIRNAFLAKRTQ